MFRLWHSFRNFWDFRVTFLDLFSELISIVQIFISDLLIFRITCLLPVTIWTSILVFNHLAWFSTPSELYFHSSFKPLLPHFLWGCPFDFVDRIRIPLQPLRILLRGGLQGVVVIYKGVNRTPDNVPHPSNRFGGVVVVVWGGGILLTVRHCHKFFHEILAFVGFM
jgi:hypothetical protein